MVLWVLFTERVAAPTSVSADAGHNLVPSSEVGGWVRFDNTCFVVGAQRRLEEDPGRRTTLLDD